MEEEEDLEDIKSQKVDNQLQIKNNKKTKAKSLAI